MKDKKIKFIFDNGVPEELKKFNLQFALELNRYIELRDEFDELAKSVGVQEDGKMVWVSLKSSPKKVIKEISDRSKKYVHQKDEFLDFFNNFERDEEGGFCATPDESKKFYSLIKPLNENLEQLIFLIEEGLQKNSP